MTRGSRKSKSHRRQKTGGGRKAGASMEAETPAPAAHRATWRKGVGQFVSASFDAGARALRDRLGLNTETNFIDSTSSPLTTGTLALADSGSAIPVGATLGTGQRIGREVRAVRWITKGFIAVATTTTLAGLVRVIATFNRQQDGQAFTSAQVLAANSNINSLSAGDFAERGGTIIFDRTFPLIGLSNQLLAPSAPAYVPFDFEFSVADWHLTWPSADTTGVQTANLGGAVQVWVMSNGFATTQPSVFTYSRMEYVDN